MLVPEKLCVEGSRQDTQNLTVVEFRDGDSCYILGLETTNYITDTSNTNVILFALKLQCIQ